jgi:hypothetical protein
MLQQHEREFFDRPRYSPAPLAGYSWIILWAAFNDENEEPHAVLEQLTTNRALVVLSLLHQTELRQMEHFAPSALVVLQERLVRLGRLDK